MRDAQVLRGWLRRRWLARILEKTKLDLLNALLISRGQLLGLLVDASRLDERSQIRKIGVDVIVVLRVGDGRWRLRCAGEFGTVGEAGGDARHVEVGVDVAALVVLA